MSRELSGRKSGILQERRRVPTRCPGNSGKARAVYISKGNVVHGEQHESTLFAFGSGRVSGADDRVEVAGTDIRRTGGDARRSGRFTARHARSYAGCVREDYRDS